MKYRYKEALAFVLVGLLLIVCAQGLIFPVIMFIIKVFFYLAALILLAAGINTLFTK